MKLKFVSLISGGKDSVFNTVKCVAQGHQLRCVASLLPKLKKEQDSFMYQTVGLEIAPMVAKCLEVPILTREIQGKSLNQEMYYAKLEGGEQEDYDEVEDLFELLK